jgi:transcriptional regulator with XRE-family HTH domain
MKSYEFTLVLHGAAEPTRALEDALFQSGCDDATLSRRHGVLQLEFARDAESLKDAILSAIADVRRAEAGVVVAQVDESHLVTQAEIARRSGRSRQSINQLVSGERGPGGFPPPVCHLAEDMPLWDWSDVSGWMSPLGMVGPDCEQNASEIAVINVALERQRQQSRSPSLVRSVDEALGAEA